MPTVLITGGHGGIGLECSKLLASHYRANLLLAGRSLERIEPVARELRKTYGVTVTVHKTLDAGSALSATLLKASFVRGHRSYSGRNALSVASQRRSWTSKPGEKDREFLRASQDRSIR
jgi:NAD(P)-dependent dehydrogenase (short-subunit alcohol dehydrogenase family)